MRRRSGRTGRWIARVGLLWAAVLPAAVHGQVYALEADGSVQVREGGGAVRWQRLDAPVSRTTNAGLSLPGLSAPVAPSSGSGALLQQAAAQAGLHPALLEALVWQESRWRPRAISPKGAIGLTQLMPATARQLGIDPHDPAANLFGGARHLRGLLDRFHGDLVKALAAYNAGTSRVEAAGGIPPFRETREYVAAILGRLGQTPVIR